MNLIDAFRPVTRRAIPVNYVSPGICELFLGTASGSSDDGLATLDFLGTVRLAGPTLEAFLAQSPSFGENQISGTYDEGTYVGFDALTPGSTYRWEKGVEQERFEDVITLFPNTYNTFYESTSFVATSGTFFIRKVDGLTGGTATGSLREVFNLQQIRLVWSSVPNAVFYQIYRSTSPTGPFTLLQTPVGGNTYIDTPPDTQVYYYRVTAIEPNAGETNLSNVATVALPPVAGYELWLAPESAFFSDEAATIPAESGGEVRFWRDLSGNNYHAVYPGSGLGPKFFPAVVGGKSALRFGDPTDALTLATGLLAPADSHAERTLFVVSRYTVTGDGFVDGRVQTVASYGSTSIRLRKTVGGPTLYGSSPSTILDATPATDGNAFQVFAGRNTATDFSIWRAGVMANSGAHVPTAPTAPNSKVALGFLWPNFLNSQRLTGDIAEVLFYPSALTDGEMLSISNYLKQKYNL